MFGWKFISTAAYDAMVAAQVRSDGLVKKQAEALKDQAERHAVTETDARNLASALNEQDRIMEAYGSTISRYRAELAKSWLRNAKGHFERHPTNTTPAKTKSAPKTPILDAHL